MLITGFDWLVGKFARNCHTIRRDSADIYDLVASKLPTLLAEGIIVTEAIIVEIISAGCKIPPPA